MWNLEQNDFRFKFRRFFARVFFKCFFKFLLNMERHCLGRSNYFQSCNVFLNHQDLYYSQEFISSGYKNQVKKIIITPVVVTFVIFSSN